MPLGGPRRERGRHPAVTRLAHEAVARARARPARDRPGRQGGPGLRPVSERRRWNILRFLLVCLYVGGLQSYLPLCPSFMRIQFSPFFASSLLLGFPI
jgi:hypothetical protein